MSLFKKPSELEMNPTIKMLIYGQPGIGKSSLALSAPSPVLLDFDGGIHRVNGAFHCPTLQVHSWEEVMLMWNEDLSEFKTIIIDTAGKMLDYMAAYIVKEDSNMAKRDGSLSLNGYRVRKKMFTDFIAMCSTLGKHLVFVAHEKEEKDGETKIVRPEIGGSSAADLIKELDLVGYMQAVGTDRTIFWTPQEKFYAKNTCNLPQAHKIPTIIDAKGVPTGQNNFLSTIFNNYNEYLSSQAKITEDYQGILSQISSDVNNVTDCDSANIIREKLASYNHIWDSKLKAGQMLNEKAKSIGLVFNSATKSYEAA